VTSRAGRTYETVEKRHSGDLTSGRFRKPARINAYDAERTDRQLRIDYTTPLSTRF
jgi:hypothetical protein